LSLASKRQRHDLHFSDAGWADIQAFHHVVAEQMQLAMTVFVSRDVDQARDLVTRKDWLRGEELKATERHFDRLREGKMETISTSALHLDVLRDLKRINAHLTTVAYPILEPAGVLRGSRLKATPTSEKPAKGRAYKAG
jgi:phosphate:Na+ symporter